MPGYEAEQENQVMKSLKLDRVLTNDQRRLVENPRYGKSKNKNLLELEVGFDEDKFRVLLDDCDIKSIADELGVQEEQVFLHMVIFNEPPDVLSEVTKKEMNKTKKNLSFTKMMNMLEVEKNADGKVITKA
jgi:hypothetical protein